MLITHHKKLPIFDCEFSACWAIAEADTYRCSWLVRSSLLFDLFNGDNFSEHRVDAAKVSKADDGRCAREPGPPPCLTGLGRPTQAACSLRQCANRIVKEATKTFLDGATTPDWVQWNNWVDCRKLRWTPTDRPPQRLDVELVALLTNSVETGNVVGHLSCLIDRNWSNSRWE